MSILEETVWLQSLSAAERARFLARLSHNLTVAARVLCHSSAGAEQTIEWVRQLNEVQHRVTSYLAHHHAGDEDTGWISVVVDCVLNPEDSTLLQQTEQAWLFSKGAVSRA